MSRQLVEYTNKKLMMARTSWLAAVDSEGVAREGFRQGFLFHCCGAVYGLLAEILDSCLVSPQNPVNFLQTEEILGKGKVLSGSFQHVKSLKDSDWLGGLLADFERTQKLDIADQNQQTTFENIIATSHIALSCSGHEGECLQSLQKLVQEIRGQLQEW